MQFDLIVFIGRFQPFHNGHASVVAKALTLADSVAVLCGSMNKPRSAKNPWSLEEREMLIRSVFPDSPLYIDGINDYLYDDISWVAGVNAAVDNAKYEFSLPDDAKIGLIGHFKDRSSYYLSLFPGWELIESAPEQLINATDIRAALFSDEEIDASSMLPRPVREYLVDYSSTEDFKYCTKEHQAIQKEKLKKSGYPYPNGLNDVTVDPVVVHASGKVLLVKRGGKVGNGLFALPGGFLNNDERIYDGCVRELFEETQINLSGMPEPTEISQRITRAELRRAFRRVETFDHPDRSQLGRLITHAHLFVLDTPYLPLVKGSDDATEAYWYSLSEFDTIEGDMHDDHADIIRSMVAGLRLR